MDLRSDPLAQLLLRVADVRCFSPLLLGTKVFVMPNGMLKSNQQLVDIIEKVKPEIRLLIEKCNTVGVSAGASGDSRMLLLLEGQSCSEWKEQASLYPVDEERRDSYCSV